MCIRKTNQNYNFEVLVSLILLNVLCAQYTYRLLVSEQRSGFLNPCLTFGSYRLAFAESDRLKQKPVYFVT